MDTATREKLEAVNRAAYEGMLLFPVNKAERRKTRWDYGKKQKRQKRLIKFTRLGRKLFGTRGFPQ